MSLRSDQNPWLRDAACRLEPTVLFYDESRTDEARAICQGCVVRAECLEAALNSLPTERGVWGGTTREERIRLRRESPPALPERPISHGSTSGYRVHLKRGESPCFRCAEAERAARRESRERKKASA